jgi:hypothetical protein
MPRQFPPQALAAAQAKYGHLGEIEQFLAAVKKDSPKVPTQDIGDLYLQLHPNLNLAQKRRVSLAVEPGETPNPVRDTAVMAGALTAAPAAVGATGAEALIPSLAARVIGGGAGAAGSGALYDWLEQKLAGGKGPSLSHAAGDALGGAGGELTASAASGLAGAALGPFTRPSAKLVSSVPGAVRPTIPQSIGEGAVGGLKAYLHPFTAPPHPSITKAALVDPHNLEAARNIPESDLTRIMMQQDARTASKEMIPGGSAPNIVPNISPEGAPARAAGLQELATTRANLAAAQGAQTARRAATQADIDFSSQAPYLGAKTAESNVRTAQALQNAGSVVSQPKPFVPEPNAPPVQVPAPVQPAPVAQPFPGAEPIFRPPPAMPSPARTPPQAPGAMNQDEALSSAVANERLLSHLHNTGTQPARTGTVDPRAAEGVNRVFAAHGGQEMISATAESPAVNLPSGPLPASEISRRPPFSNSPNITNPVEALDAVHSAVDMGQTTPLMSEAKEMGSFLQSRSGRKMAGGPLVEGEAQVPMQEASQIKAAAKPTAFKSTATDPETLLMSSEAKTAEAAPQNRSSLENWMRGEGDRAAVEQHQIAQQNAREAAQASHGEAVRDTGKAREGWNVAQQRQIAAQKAAEADTTNQANFQHQQDVRQYGIDRSARNEAAQDTHMMNDPLIPRPLRPGETLAGIKDPSSVEKGAFSPETHTEALLGRQHQQMAEMLLARKIAAQKAALDAEQAASHLPPRYAPPRTFDVSNTALSRLGSKGVPAGGNAEPHLSTIESLPHALERGMFKRGVDWFTRTEPRATTDAMATPRLLDLMENRGLSDVNEPLGPTGRRGLARAAGGLTADIGGQALARYFLGGYNKEK